MDKSLFWLIFKVIKLLYSAAFTDPDGSGGPPKGLAPLCPQIGGIHPMEPCKSCCVFLRPLKSPWRGFRGIQEESAGEER